MPTVDQVIVWVVVGLLGGGIASLVITWNRPGFARGARKRRIEHRCILNRGDQERLPSRSTTYSDLPGYAG